MLIHLLLTTISILIFSKFTIPKDKKVNFSLSFSLSILIYFTCYVMDLGSLGKEIAVFNPFSVIFLFMHPLVSLLTRKDIRNKHAMLLMASFLVQYSGHVSIFFIMGITFLGIRWVSRKRYIIEELIYIGSFLIPISDYYFKNETGSFLGIFLFLLILLSCFYLTFFRLIETSSLLTIFMLILTLNIKNLGLEWEFSTYIINILFALSAISLVLTLLFHNVKVHIPVLILANAMFLLAGPESISLCISLLVLIFLIGLIEELKITIDSMEFTKFFLALSLLLIMNLIQFVTFEFYIILLAILVPVMTYYIEEKRIVTN